MTSQELDDLQRICPQCGQDLRLPPDVYARLKKIIIKVKIIIELVEEMEL